jgi:CheY-like chemotaxis protein
MIFKPKYKILVADDDAVFCEVIKELLQNNGYKVLIAKDGEEAVSMTRDYLPDLIFMDIIMPKLNGEAAMVRIKSEPETRPIPIIILTGVEDIHEYRLSKTMGALDYIVKPYEPQKLLEKIKEVIQTRGPSTHKQQR